MIDNQKLVWMAQGERLRQICKKLGISQKKLAELLLVQPGNISNAIKGRRGVPSKWSIILKKEYPKVNVRWLLYGEGQMFDTLSDHPSSGDRISYVESNSLHPQGNAREMTMSEVQARLLLLEARLDEVLSRTAMHDQDIGTLKIAIDNIKRLWD